MKFLMCPDCGKRGVTLRLRSNGEDHYGCRYCDWAAYTQGHSEIDAWRLRKLDAVNEYRP